MRIEKTGNTIEASARRLYDVYVMAKGGLAHDGSKLVAFDRLTDDIRNAWFAVGATALNLDAGVLGTPTIGRATTSQTHAHS